MIRNYLTTTFRNFLRNANYTIINVLGLSIGVTACVVIYLLIRYELDFDRFNTRFERIYRIVQKSADGTEVEYGSTVPYPMITAFRSDIADVPLATAIHYEDDAVLKIGAEKLRVPHVIFADSLFFSVFDFEVISGNPRVELGEPNKVFLTKSLADKIMKGEERLSFKMDNNLDLEVAGIIADPPATSHMKFSMIVSYPSMNRQVLNSFPTDSWEMTMSGYTYFVLPDAMVPGRVEETLKGFPKKYREEDTTPVEYSLQALKDIHFSKEFTENPGPSPNADYASLITLGVLVWFILAIACVNFVNLATALTIKKSKEIGIRKTLGAKRTSLTLYFLTETFIIILVAIVISLACTEWLLKWLNVFLEKSLSLNFFGNPELIFFVIVLALAATLLSGFYPAMILSGFNPVTVLKNKMSAQGSGTLVRKTLVVFQFTIAQVLIIGTLIVADQMNYFQSKPLGFDKDAVINVAIPNNDRKLMESFKNRLDGITGIESVSLSLGGPASDNNFGTNSFLSETGKDGAFSVSIKPVDFDYREVYGLTMKAGRWFTEAEEKAASNPDANQGAYVYIVNESYTRRLGFAAPDEIVGKKITTGINAIDAEVIGVVADFHARSLHETIDPIVLVSFPYFYYDAGIKISAGSPSAVLKEIGKAYDEVFPEFDFRYQFMDDYLATLYRQDERTFTLFKIFSVVSIFIGCLGLYGLISFMANQKLKEVGIRKVLGASVSNIVTLFGKEFVKLIAIAFVIAAPLTLYFMSEWLNGFAYRTPVAWTNFLVGIGATVIIALVTVSYRSIRSAMANPVDVLRSE